LLVLGGGYAGILTAQEAVRTGARVALVERNLLGGVCLNAGCISSKAMIRTSRLYAEMRDAARYGARRPADIQVDFAAVMERVGRVHARASRRRSAHELAAAGIDVFFGDAHFAGPDSVELSGETLRFKKALIAAGARPLIPAIPGLAEAGYLTNETVFELTEAPRSLVVIGGGPLGCELGQAFCRLGSQVSIVQDEPLFLGQEERDAAQILSESLSRDGIGIHLNTETIRVRVEDGRKLIDLRSDDYESTVEADRILVAAGRAPNVQGLNLEAQWPEFGSTTICGLRTGESTRRGMFVWSINLPTSKGRRRTSLFRMRCFAGTKDLVR
jgi:pyruvate/2-oxoglutarate dehydrogenase complex dihydrolipoamide dehydrogenase (E3) component